MTSWPSFVKTMAYSVAARRNSTAINGTALMPALKAYVLEGSYDILPWRAADTGTALS